MTDDRRIALGSSIKALDNGNVGGYLIAFTDENKRDLYGEYFSPETELRMSDFGVEGHPVLFHHGLDETIKAHAIGKVVKAELSDKGLWIEARLKERDEYTEWVKELMASGELGWSSGALPQAVRVSDAGHIEEWPVIEASITHTPAMPIDTAITSIRSLSKTALRGRPQGAKEVTVSTSANTVATVTIDFPDSTISHDTQETTQGENPTMNINKSKALKALDEEQRLEVVGIIEQMLNDYVGLMKEEARANEDYDEEAGRMADEEAEAVAAAKMEEELDGEEVKTANVRALAENKTFITAIAQAWLKAYNDARKSRLDSRRSLLADVLGDVQNAPGKSKKSEAGLKSSGNISVGEDRKYAHLTAAQMALGADMVVAPMRNSGLPAHIALQTLSPEYLRTMVNKAYKEAEKEPYKDHRDNAALKASIPFRADEINASNIAGQGTEWLSNFYSTVLWEKARNNTIYGKVLAKGMWEYEIPQGASTAYFPSEGADPIAYATKEANDLATGRVEATANIGFIGTGQVSVTPKELKLATGVTTILEEDSIINMVQQTERQLQTAAMEYLDRLMINGDTETGASTNINLIDGTPASGVTTTPYYIASNGFRKHPLVTATAYSRDASTTLDLADYRLTYGLMDSAVRERRENIVFIVDSDTHLASLAISEIATEDVRRQFAATITSGSVLNLYGIDVLDSGFLPLSNTAGKVSATPGNNTRGSILAVYAPYWAVGWKRRITLETGRDIYSGTNIYVLSMRLGFVARGNSSAAISYNVAVS